jgi:hypothetical protein
METERISAAAFGAAWSSLRDDQKRAIVADVRLIQKDEGKTELQAIRLLLKRIGGTEALYDYADVLLVHGRQDKGA